MRLLVLMMSVLIITGCTNKTEEVVQEEITVTDSPAEDTTLPNDLVSESSSSAQTGGPVIVDINQIFENLSDEEKVFIDFYLRMEEKMFQSKFTSNLSTMDKNLTYLESNLNRNLTELEKTAWNTTLDIYEEAKQMVYLPSLPLDRELIQDSGISFTIDEQNHFNMIMDLLESIEENARIREVEMELEIRFTAEEKSNYIAGYKLFMEAMTQPKTSGDE